MAKARVIDMSCYLPPDEDGNPREHADVPVRPGGDGPERQPAPPGYGFANYGTVFASAKDAFSDSDSGPSHHGGMSLDSFIGTMDEAGVQMGVIGGASNANLAKYIQAAPDRFFGLARINPYDGMRAVRELERLVREEGFRGMAVSSLYNLTPASDRRYYPLYSKCIELGIPIRIYAGMSFANDRPYDLGHPRHIDQVAVDFPELRICAGLSGWPWVNEMVALVRRHPNLYCDTSAHRARHFATNGSGWDQFMQYGNTLIQDKIMVGFAAGLLRMPLETIVDEYLALPLKESVKEKWLYGNAVRFLGLDR